LSTHLSLLSAVPPITDIEPTGERGFVLLVVYVIIAVGFSFFCSIAEAALLSVTPSFIATVKQQGKKGAELLEQLKRKVDRPLAAILSLNTIAHTVGAAGVGAEAAAIWGSGFVGLASAIMTLVILIFSEIIPKTIGATYWRRLALPLAPVIQGLIWILLPLVWLSDLLTRLMGGGHVHAIVTREEVAALAMIGARQGQLDDDETRILENLFRLNSLSVRDIMTPRTVIIAFDQEATIGDALTQRRELPVSRIPIYDESIDSVTGLVLKTDLLLAQANGQLDLPLRELKRNIRAVSRHASLKRLLETLLDQREHIALVVDEYGGTDGVVTLEDLMETLLGSEIVDEKDSSPDMRALARKKWKRRAEALGLDVSHVKNPAAEPEAPHAPAKRNQERQTTTEQDDTTGNGNSDLR
jgi:CBS domain containing-hemolysin-like protein